VHGNFLDEEIVVSVLVNVLGIRAILLCNFA
jgi:hypothetical protein